MKICIIKCAEFWRKNPNRNSTSKF